MLCPQGSTEKDIVRVLNERGGLLLRTLAADAADHLLTEVFMFVCVCVCDVMMLCLYLI